MSRAGFLLILAAGLCSDAVSTWAEAALDRSQPAATTSIGIELVKAVPWPAAAILISIILYRPLSMFLGAIGSRITKLSVFKVELELVPATSTATTPLLDEIRSATTAAMVSDSSGAMIQQVQSMAPADYAVIDLGDGLEWLTSRLYVAAVMMQRMRGVKIFVVVERTPATQQRLVAVVEVSQLRWALAQRYPWLEAAWVRANLVSICSWPPPAVQSSGLPVPALPPDANWLPDTRTPNSNWSQIVCNPTGAFDPYVASEVVKNFITSLQQTTPPAAPLDPREWEELDGSRYERAGWVTRSLLTSLVPKEAFSAWVGGLRDVSRGQRTRAVLRRVADFVAQTEGDREFVRLVNRRVLLEDVAASLGEEPEVGRI